MILSTMRILAVFCFLCLSLCCAQVWELSQSFPSTTVGDYFGTSLCLSPDGLYAMAGSVPLATYGSVTVLHRSSIQANWVITQTLMASDKVTGDNFGYSCDIASSSQGFVAIIGANSNNKAYIFSLIGSTWTQTTILAPQAGTTTDFGTSVAISGLGVALVGAPSGLTSTSIGGYTFLFQTTDTTFQTGWTQSSFPCFENQGDNGFGYSLSIAQFSSTVLVAAFGAPTTNYNISSNDDYYTLPTGAVFIGKLMLAAGVWSVQFQQTILPPAKNNVTLGSKFGNQVILAYENTHINGHYLGFVLSIAALLADSPQGAADAGALFGYVTLSASSFTEWIDLPFNPIGTGIPNSDYGSGISYDPVQKVFAVGAPFQSYGSPGLPCGAVYTYFLQLQTNTSVICPYTYGQLSSSSDPPAFGHAIAIYDGTLLVGAQNAGNTAGAIYSYVLPVSSSNDDGLPPASIYGAIVGSILGAALVAGLYYHFFIAVPAAAAAAKSAAIASGSNIAVAAAPSVHSPMANSAAAYHNKI